MSLPHSMNPFCAKNLLINSHDGPTMLYSPQMLYSLACVCVISHRVYKELLMMTERQQQTHITLKSYLHKVDYFPTAIKFFYMLRVNLLAQIPSLDSETRSVRHCQSAQTACSRNDMDTRKSFIRSQMYTPWYPKASYFCICFLLLLFHPILG